MRVTGRQEASTSEGPTRSAWPHWLEVSCVAPWLNGLLCINVAIMPLLQQCWTDMQNVMSMPSAACVHSKACVKLSQLFALFSAILKIKVDFIGIYGGIG